MDWHGERLGRDLNAELNNWRYRQDSMLRVLVIVESAAVRLVNANKVQEAVKHIDFTPLGEQEDVFLIKVV
jgi:hypothetical protein